MSKHAFYLCIDYGKSKVGLAVGSMIPATPIEVVRYSSQEHLLSQVLDVIESERPEVLLLGWPAEHLTTSTVQTDEIKQFGDELGGLTGLPVVYYPETLSTQLAQRRMVEAGVPQKRRRELEDSYAAAAILDNYLREME